jgi:hypothetical protein
MKCEQCGGECVIKTNNCEGLGFDFETKEQLKGKLITENKDYVEKCKFCGKHLCVGCTFLKIPQHTYKSRITYCKDCEEALHNFEISDAKS